MSRYDELAHEIYCGCKVPGGDKRIAEGLQTFCHGYWGGCMDDLEKEVEAAKNETKAVHANLTKMLTEVRTELDETKAELATVSSARNKWYLDYEDMVNQTLKAEASEVAKDELLKTTVETLRLTQIERDNFKTAAIENAEIIETLRVKLQYADADRVKYADAVQRRIADVEQAKLDLEVCRRANSSLTGSLNVANDELRKNEAELDRMRVSRDQEKKWRIDATDKLNRAAAATARAKEELLEVKAELNDRAGELEATKKQARRDLEFADKECMKLRGEVKKMATIINEQVQASVKLCLDLEESEARNGLLFTTGEELKRQLIMTTEELTVAKADLNGIACDRDHARGDNMILAEERHRLMNDLADVRRQYIEASTAEERARTQVGVLSKELSKAHEASSHYNVAELKSKLAVAEADLRDAKYLLDNNGTLNVVKELNIVKAERDGLTARLADANGRLAKIFDLI